MTSSDRDDDKGIARDNGVRATDVADSFTIDAEQVRIFVWIFPPEQTNYSKRAACRRHP